MNKKEILKEIDELIETVEFGAYVGETLIQKLQEIKTKIESELNE